MSVIRFPGIAESDHPHYLWNEQEYICRQLFQAKVGWSFGFAPEDNRWVQFSNHPDACTSLTTHGAADIFGPHISRGWLTTETAWVYYRLDASDIYREATRPIYSQYLHGWYHPTNGDRAIAFIDSELPVSRRVIIMDSPNSMYEYDVRAATAASPIHWELTTPSDTFLAAGSFTLDPGNYLFELRGGNGGNGGAGGWVRSDPVAPSGTPIPGGIGGTSVSVVYELILHHTAVFQAILGGNGNAGTDGNARARRQSGGGEGHYEHLMTGGGGGSSGGDTILRTSDGRILAISRGGAGGGGGPASASLHSRFNTFQASGGGGGGAGVPDGGDGGSWFGQTEIQGFPAQDVGVDINGGQGGHNPNGGTGGERTNTNTILSQGVNGQPGQAVTVGNRRNGGDSPDMLNPSWGNSPLPGGRGGTGFIGTSGWFRVRKRDML